MIRYPIEVVGIRGRAWHTEDVSTAPQVSRPVLVFDGDCAFCTRCVDLARRWFGRQPHIVPWQRADLDELGLTRDACESAVQFVDADGRISSGEVAVARLLIFAGRGWRLLGLVILAPGVRQSSGFVYRWIARNRHRLPGGTAECRLPDEPTRPSDGESPR